MASKRTLLRYGVLDGVLTADPAARLPGRGAYTCRGGDCFTVACRRGAFARALRRALEIGPAPLAGENVHLERV